MRLKEQISDPYIFDGCENIDLWLDANWDESDNNYDTWCSMSEEMYGIVMMAVGPLNYYYDVNPAAAACCCVADGYEIENCEEEETPEFDMSTCEYPFNTYSPETQNNLCNTFYSGQGNVPDATWNNLLNNILGPNGECCPDQEIVEPEDEIEPFTPTTSPVEMCYKFNGLTEPQQGKFCTRCEQDEPTLDPIYGPNQDQYWLGGPYGQLNASDCKCCDKPSPIKPKKGGPIKLKESVVKRFQKLAGIKKSKK